MFIQGITTITNVASGFNSGYSTVKNFTKTAEYKGFTTWAQVTWQTGKTAFKAYELQRVISILSRTVSQKAIVATFSAWAALYGLSSLFAYKGLAPYGAGAMYEPNKIVEYTPHLVAITRVALCAVEYTVKPQKALASFTVMALALTDTTALLGKELSYGFHNVLPIAAKVTLFILGGPITKVVMGVELVASALFRSF